MKRFMAFFLAVVMMVNMLPLQVFAADTVVIDDPEIIEQLVNGEADISDLLAGEKAEDNKSDTITVETKIPEDLPDDLTLFMDYMSMQQGDIASSMSTAGREALNPIEKGIYDYLLDKISHIANEGGKAEFDNTEFKNYSGIKYSWKPEEVGASKFTDETASAAVSRFFAQFSMQRIVDALLHDNPLECYWIDKTSSISTSYSYSWNNYYFEVVALNFAIPTSQVFGTGLDQYSVGNTAAQWKQASQETVETIVANAVNGTDSLFGRLQYLKDYICSVASYNFSAAESGNYTMDSLPWQAIGVLSGYYTEVVCEGYSKAFQTLCDELRKYDDRFECYTVTGVMDGGTGAGGHMWNVVSVDGKNYIVDITNCDSGTIGQGTKLLMAGAEGSVYGGYYVNIDGYYVAYLYDEDTVNLLGADVLEISSSAYSESEPEQPSNKCGDNATWTFDEATGTLTISGTGEMYDYFGDASDRPWNRYGRDLKYVVIEDGITRVGGQAFWNLSGIETIIVGKDVTEISDFAFTTCMSLEYISLPASLSVVGRNVSMNWGENVEIHYEGTAQQWEALLPKLDDGNDLLRFGKIILGDGSIYGQSGSVKQRYRVTFVFPNGDQMTTEFIEDLPINSPSNGNKAPTGDFDGWYTDSKCTQRWDMDNDPVTGHMTLYSKENKPIDSSMCGGNATWSYDEETGTLTISGSGEMYDYNSREERPWNQYSRDIRHIVIDDGITKIGTAAFWDFGMVETLILGNTVTHIGQIAFATCGQFKSIVIPQNLTYIGYRAFYNCGNNAEIFYYGTESQWDNITIEDENSVLSKDRVVFNYRPDAVYKVTFETNVPGLEVEPIYVKQGGRITELPNLPLDGYLLTSWWDSPTFDSFEPWTVETDRVYNDITLYARWKKVNTTGAADISPAPDNRNLKVVLTQTEGGKLVSDMSKVGKGDSVLLTAIPDEGYVVVGIVHKLFYTPETFVAGDTALVYVGPFADIEARAIFRKAPMGTCGEGAKWVFDEYTSTLTIFGTGYVENTYPDPQPWADYRTQINKIVVEEGITYIEGDIFGDVRSLETLVLPEGFEEISPLCFSGCSNLRTIYMPSTVGFIGAKSFSGCRSLETVYYNATQYKWNKIRYQIPDDAALFNGKVIFNNETIASDIANKDGSARWTLYTDGTFVVSGTGNMFDGKRLYEPYINDIKDVVIEDGITSIGLAAFTGCENLETVIIADSVTSIGANAFSYCTSLKEIAIPEGVVGIASSTFAGCESLEYVTLPESLRNIGEEAFWNCNSLKEIVFPELLEQIYQRAFTLCESLTEVIIPDNVNFIGSEVFASCTNLKYVELSDNIETIMSGLFYNCPNLKEIVIPDKVTGIGRHAFWDCTSLETITIPEAMVMIGDESFLNCNALETVFYNGSSTQWKAVEIKGENPFKNTDIIFSSYTVNFVTGVEGLEVDPIEVGHGGRLYRLPNLKREGYLLKAWWANEKFKGWSWTVETDRVYSDITLYAQWQTLYTTGADLPADQWKIKKVTIKDADGNDLSKLNVNVYDETAVTLIKVETEGVGNYNSNVNVKSTNDFVATVTETDVPGEYLVYTNGKGTATITFTSEENSKIKDTLTVTAKQMADSVKFEISKNITNDGSQILTVGQTVSPKVQWLNGESWPEYEIVLEEGSTGVIYENGKLKATGAGNGEVIVNAYGENGKTMFYRVPYIVYNEKVKAITVDNAKVVLDPLANFTEKVITAVPSNLGACEEFDISWNINVAISVEKLSDNSVIVRANSNDKATVTVTFKAKDGSGKTTKATVQTGISVKALHLTAPADQIAIGKSIKLTANVVPESATVKTLSWSAVDYDTKEPTDIVTVNNGTVKGVKAGKAIIIAQATDGTGVYAEAVIEVVDAANMVKIYKDEHCTEIAKNITAIVHGKNEVVNITLPVEVVNKAGDILDQDVAVTVKAPSGVEEPYCVYENGEITFSAWMPGKYTVTAATIDGTNKKATVTITVEQHLFSFEATAPKNTQVIYTDVDEIWVVKEGATITPQVVYNGNEKLFVPTAVAKKYVISTTEENLVLNKTATNVKTVKAGSEDYEITISAVDCGCDNASSLTKTVKIRVLPKNSVDFTKVVLDLPEGLLDSAALAYVPAGTAQQFTVYLNGVKGSGFTAEWSVDSTDVTISKTGKLDLKNAEIGKTYTVTAILTDKSNPANAVTVSKEVVAIRKLAKTDIKLLTVADNTPVTALVYTPEDSGDEIYVSVPEDAMQIFALKSSNENILSVTETVTNRQWKLTPKGTGSVTLTVESKEGSKVKQTFKLTVKPVANPLKAINVNSKTITVQPNVAIAIPYLLTATKADAPTMAAVKWEVSDSTKALIANDGNSPFGKSIVETDISGYINLKGLKEGKITLTGTALDGSKRTVKITINVVNSRQAQFTTDLVLTAPANAKLDKQTGLPVVQWGKAVQMKATVVPPQAKNKTIGWEVVDKYTGQPVAGVTISNGKLTVATASDKLTPFTGVATVRAYLKDYLTADLEYIEDTIDVEIKAPLDNIRITNADSMYPGESRQLKVEFVYNKYDTERNTDYPLVWSVSDTKLAEIDSEGNLTVKETAAVGKSFKVTLAVLDGSDKKVTATIKVVEQKPESVNYNETITILGQTSNEANVSILRDQLTKAGFKVNVKVVPDAAAWRQQINAGNYDITLTGWSTVTGNIDYAVRGVYHSTGNYNYGPINDPMVDLLIDRAATETHQKAAATYKELENFLVKEMAYTLPLYASMKIGAYKNNLLKSESVIFPKSGSARWENYEYKNSAYNKTRVLVLTQTSSAITTLDPIQANDGTMVKLSANMYIKLINMDENDQITTDGSLSHAYAVGQGNKTFYFLLRDDVNFSKTENGDVKDTGVLVAADDVVYSLRRARDKNTINTHKTYTLHENMETIEIVTDINELKNVKDSETDISVFDKLNTAVNTPVRALTAADENVNNKNGVYQVVKVTTKTPFPQVLNYLAHQSAGILHKEQVEKYNSAFDGKNYDPTKDICYGDYAQVKGGITDMLWCSGPYQLIQADDYGIEYEKNPGYMPDDKNFAPKISNIYMKFIKDTALATAAFRADVVDILDSVSMPDVSLLEKDSKNTVVKRSSNGVTFAVFNMQSGSKMQDVNLRKAIFYAINQQDFVTFNTGFVTPVYSTISTLIDTGNVHKQNLVDSSNYLKAYVNSTK